MKTIREINIKDWSGYAFTNMTNIDEFDPDFLLVNHFKSSKDECLKLTIVFKIAYCEENNVSNIVFNNIECIFRKSGIFSYLIFVKVIKTKRCWIIMPR